MKSSNQPSKNDYQFFTFKQTVNKKLLQSKQMDKLLKNQDYWSPNSKKLNNILTNGRYKSLKINEIFQHTEKCLTIRLQLYGNRHSTIIKQIQNIFYPNLKKLDLDSNQISNIQPLSVMNFQKLELLSLMNNKISQIKSFEKLVWPNLSQLFFSFNPLVQAKALTQSQIIIQLVDRLILQLGGGQYFQNLIKNDLSFLVKFPAKFLEYLFVKGQKRINQPKLDIILKSRFINITICKKVDIKPIAKRQSIVKRQ